MGRDELQRGLLRFTAAVAAGGPSLPLPELGPAAAAAPLARGIAASSDDAELLAAPAPRKYAMEVEVTRVWCPDRQKELNKK